MIEVEAVRQLDQPLGLGDDPFARRARPEVAEHAIPAAESRNARSYALDDPGEFRRGRERERRLVLIFAGDDQRVEKVERGGLHRDDRLSLASDRIGQIFELEVVRTAEAGTQDRFHEVAPYPHPRLLDDLSQHLGPRSSAALGTRSAAPVLSATVPSGLIFT